MTETLPKSARALGCIRQPAVGQKTHFTAHRLTPEGGQRDAWTLNTEPTMESKTFKRLDITGPFSKSFSAKPVSAKPRGGELRWSNGKRLSTAYTEASVNPAIDVVTGLQFHAISASRNSGEENHLEDQRTSNERQSPKSERTKTATDQRRVDRARSFVKLSRQMGNQWPPKHNYLEDGDFVKGKGHRIDTGPMSRPVSGWMNRESRNAVELAEKDNGDCVLGRYYSLDVETGAVTARQLTNAANNVIIGVNGRERKPEVNGRCTEDGEEAEDLASDAEGYEIVNVESDEIPSRFVPLCWDDQFERAKVKVVEPRLPSAKPPSTGVNESKPVVFWTRDPQRGVAPPSVTKFHSHTKENLLSMALQKRSGQTAKRRQHSVRFDDFLHRFVRSEGVEPPTVGEGMGRQDGFRQGFRENGGMRGGNLLAGRDSPRKVDLVPRSHGRLGDLYGNMIIVGSSQISSSVNKHPKSEKPVGWGGAAASEQLLPSQNRRGSGGGRETVGDSTPREVSIINIVQPIRGALGEGFRGTLGEGFRGTLGEGSGDPGDTSAVVNTAPGASGRSRNDPVAGVRLRYSVRNARASTGLRRGRPDGGFLLRRTTASMARSASSSSAREDRLARTPTASTPDGSGPSGNDWNLNCINIKPALRSEARKDHRTTQTDKTEEDWSNEDADPTGDKDRDAVASDALRVSQPFDAVQPSPAVVVKTGSPPTKGTFPPDNQLTLTKDGATLGESSEISSAPPPSRAVTPNARRAPSAKTVPVRAGDHSPGHDTRRSTVTLRLPSVAKSVQSSEAGDPPPRSPDIDEEECLLREEAERSSEGFDEGRKGEIELEAEAEETGSTTVEEEQIERQSPAAV